MKLYECPEQHVISNSPGECIECLEPLQEVEYINKSFLDELRAFIDNTQTVDDNQDYHDEAYRLDDVLTNILRMIEAQL